MRMHRASLTKKIKGLLGQLSSKNAFLLSKSTANKPKLGTYLDVLKHGMIRIQAREWTGLFWGEGGS